MTELTHLLGCELTPVEKSLIGFGESRGSRLERERIIKVLEELAYIDEQGHEMIGEFKSDLIALIKGEQK